MQRNCLKVGDKSSAGGTVIDGIPTCTHHGGELTYLGARVACPSCKSMGQIVPKGPRLPYSLMGKEVALEGDVCSCRCYPPPTMIASQSTMFQTFESHHLAEQGFAATGLPLTPDPVSNFDERVRVLDENGHPVAGEPFHIKTDAGAIHKGVTDEDGYCPRVYTSDAQNLDIAIGYKAVERWNA
ncbi:PAAR domain-containing protein [Burkholderia sp. Ac-20353]|uniref:PAAR domain-containing protein n=1 Tax=Burkholderia sp. Ac-20353 TaxID=2703894 RepID=UPI00197C0CB2|nr:PAAR domain-containing protein [Burkholderia sp. Ac-20353]MBN3790635.1 PAAR domain-containing protein [Burkholderia sp. Ac-20353]